MVTESAGCPVDFSEMLFGDVQVLFLFLEN